MSAQGHSHLQTVSSRATFSSKGKVGGPGSHRAYALRDLGITHVPCVIQKAATPSELTSVAAGALRKRPDFYVKEPRPPVLKDYFESRLRQVLRLRPINRHVKVRFTVETYDVYKK
jgi:hypothetical protein